MSTTALPPARRDWGIVGASLRSPDTRDALGAAGRALHLGRRAAALARACASSARSASLLVAPEDPAALLDALADPRDPHRHADGHRKGLSARTPPAISTLAHPDIAWRPRATRTAPQTAHGFLAEALARRRAAGMRRPSPCCAATTFPPTARRCAGCCSSSPSCAAPTLAASSPTRSLSRRAWSTASCRRPPTPTARAYLRQLGVEDAWPVMTEPFCQWVVEDNFPPAGLAGKASA